MRRWTNGLPGATARLGATMAPFEASQLVSLGCARIPILARSINAPHQRSDTLMQLSRSPTQRSALRRTAGPYKVALSAIAAAAPRYGRKRRNYSPGLENKEAGCKWQWLTQTCPRQLAHAATQHASRAALRARPIVYLVGVEADEGPSARETRLAALAA
jgi:hypothetical protein